MTMMTMTRTMMTKKSRAVAQDNDDKNSNRKMTMTMMTTTRTMMTKKSRAVAQDELNAADSEKITGIGILTFIRLVLIMIMVIMV